MNEHTEKAVLLLIDTVAMMTDMYQLAAKSIAREHHINGNEKAAQNVERSIETYTDMMRTVIGTSIMLTNATEDEASTIMRKATESLKERNKLLSAFRGSHGKAH